MAEWIKKGGALPNIPELVSELTTPTYTFIGGKFQIEDKDQIKDRIGRSPDLADALALTFAIADAPAAINMPPGYTPSGKQVKHEYDPYASERI